MWPGPHAESTPDKAAVIVADTGETLTYKELDDGSNRLAQLLHDVGLRWGDHIAFVHGNDTRFHELCWAAQRSGLYYTAINWHFNADEVAYIVENCDATVLIVSDEFREMAAELTPMLDDEVATRLLIGGALDGWENYEDAVSRYPAKPIDHELEGHAMLYSSGTTGRPKGVKYKLTREPVGNAPVMVEAFRHLYGFDDTSVYLHPAPLYHSAPLQFTMLALRLGGTVIITRGFDPEGALQAIEEYGVTHSQWVPTMFVRMLKLPEDVRNRYDVSSLQVAIHAAAPCPVEIKRAMIEWWGPVLHEYYAATEGIGATFINSEEWLEHPGSVGTSMLGPVHILDEDGNEVPTGDIGVVWFEGSGSPLSFEYHKDEEQTKESHDTHGWATTFDMGYVDEDGYLYLTDRKTFMIISGGVNIYPQEAENLLVEHPKVMDAAVFGVPNDEMGEEVKAVVQPLDMTDAGEEFERELIAYCRENLAHYKCPRSVDFEAELPRHDTGKLYKRLLRDRYWGDNESRIMS
ncbi:MAG: AMP-binding protein [Acidimicrobiia bacterium]|nr:AMP-binding protein [Acidimicrobiia bacterium]